MSNVVPSANMNLPIPIVGVDPGPDYAVNVNIALNTIDAHDHTLAKGVPIHPGGLNINSDLTFQSNNAINLRTTRYTSQANPLALGSDVGITYVVGADLYYNDTAGNQVRMTQGGSVAGAAGSITGLTAPATASYSVIGKSFIWQSDVNTPASLDAGSVVFRNISAASNGVTVQAPAALGANYNLTLPLAPVATSFLGIDSSGNIASVASVSQGITRNNLSPLGQVSSNTIDIISSSTALLTICSVSITTTGRPIMLTLQSAGGVNQSFIEITNTTGSFSEVTFRFAIGSTTIAQQGVQGAPSVIIPSSSLSHLDVQSAGTYTYLLQGFISFVPFGPKQFFSLGNAKLVAWEL